MRLVQRTTRLIVIQCVLLMLVLSSAHADKGANHQTRLPRPIELGVSGGDYDHLDCPSSCYCCAGTLGALVEASDGTRYILSNNHVTGKVNRSSPGDLVIQPGLIDQNPVCVPDGGDAVAAFTDLIPIVAGVDNSVDAAIAEVAPGQVRDDGSILDIGPLSSETLEAFVGLGVKKSARTTGLTTGQVVAVGVSVNVGYSTQCGGSTDFVARFVNQIRIQSTKGRPGGFSAGGDSGAVIVEDVQANPRAVGLLYAGSSIDTIANPIDDVLSAPWSVGQLVMTGGTPPPPPEDCGNGIDDDGDGAVDCIDSDCQVDADGDGYGAAPCGSDCDDGDNSIHPGATEECDGVDNDCDAQVDEGLDCGALGASAIVDCITWTTEGGKNGDKHMNFVVRIVDDAGQPVAAASVSVQVDLNGGNFSSASGTTDGNGNVAFTAKNSPNGCYEVDVTDVVAVGLDFDGSEPINGFAKGTDSTPDADCVSGSDTCAGGSSVASSGSAARSGPGLRAALAAKGRHEAGLFDVPGVVGVGIGLGAAGNPVIEVYLETDSPSARTRIPMQIETVPTRVIVTGPYVAY